MTVSDMARRGAGPPPVAARRRWGPLAVLWGARARGRVRDTVRASRQPLLHGLLTVFPFLRSWGGFI